LAWAGEVVVLDSKQLGRLRRVADPRVVWISEAADFTPWLAENIDVLADELGMTLTVIQTEVAVGGFRLDIRAEDGDGRTVIIENQLERTDHSHLGQCLVYAAGLEAATVIWVSPAFRDEFRRALDWLNERTDTGVQFFGVEVGVVQIGEDGPRAPVFNVVSRPNDWQKQVKDKNPLQVPSPPSSANQARQDFYADLLENVIAVRPAIRAPKRRTDNWVSFASGPFGNWCLSNTNDGRLRIEAYLDCGDQVRNEALLDEAVQGAAWVPPLPTDLAFERLDGKRACRIAAYLDFDPATQPDPGVREAELGRARERLIAMYDALNEPLRKRAKELRGQTPGAEIPQP
jgi:hypothetical protein